jgi:hypothetical protein
MAAGAAINPVKGEGSTGEPVLAGAFLTTSGIEAEKVFDPSVILA